MTLRFNIGVAGFMGTEDTYKLEKQATVLLHEIKVRIADYNKISYQFNEEATWLDLYTSPAFADEAWAEFYTDPFITLNVIVPNETVYEENKLVQKATTLTNLNYKAQTLGEDYAMLMWMSKQIDLMVLLWNGEEHTEKGYIWQLIETCKNHHIPCIWIDTKEVGKCYWFENCYHEPYDQAYLKQYIDSIYNCEGMRTEIKKDYIFLSGLWGWVYKRYIQKKKFKQVVSLCEIKDMILEETYEIPVQNEKIINNYHKLKNYYRAFDNKALAIAKRHRELVYFRSILGFSSTVFLAIGFYIETLFGFLCKWQFFGVNGWTLIAGICFLIHGAVNGYGYYMWEDKNKAVKERKSEFLNSRYIAEYLRNAIRFVVFGIPVRDTDTMRESLLSSGGINRDAFVMVHHLSRSLEPVDFKFQPETSQRMLSFILEMIEDQIHYHEGKKAKMEKIAMHLKRLAGVSFWIGFIFVSFRGGLQFVLAILDKNEWLGHNGIALDSLIRSFSNMLALVFPAWAAYFSSKLSMNNFEGLRKHSEGAISELENLKRKVEAVGKRTYISYEMLSSLSEDVLLQQISEVNDWYVQTASRTITKL